MKTLADQWKEDQSTDGFIPVPDHHKLRYNHIPTQDELRYRKNSIPEMQAVDGIVSMSQEYLDARYEVACFFNPETNKLMVVTVDLHPEDDED